MQSKNLVNENIEKIQNLFPNCVTEALDEEGKLTKLVDFDMLKQELSREVVEGNDERYVLNWAGKKQSILTANAPIAKTLRPCREESVDFDHTQNLYIEGDNLDVLKLLRETYLGKIKMIYIDPPYNTGNDFVYEDDFASSAEDYLQASKSYDDQGNRMFQNNDSNGRFHSDWLSMMYSRLKLAKDLLTDDGAIFISIDDNEQANLKKICDEIFGENNFVACLAVENNPKGRKNGKFFAINYENCLVYVKNFNISRGFNDVIPKENMQRDSIGYYSPGQRVLVGKSSNKVTNDIKSDKYYFVYYKEGCPLEIKKEITNDLMDYKLYISKNDKDQIIENTYTSYKLVELYNQNNLIFKANTIYEKDRNVYKQQKTLICTSQYYDLKTESANFQDGIFDLKNIFSMPKNVEYIKMLLKLNTERNDIVLDFFSGSATTAHAVMQLNAEDGGNRKYIMVQLPEVCDEKSEAYKAGYKTICEIGKERIRRAGKKIKDKINSEINNLDVGFRCLKLDSSCMKDIYYSPNKTTQDLLTQFEDNIKENRTPEDLLFQVMLDMGVMLSSKIIAKRMALVNGKYDFIDDAQLNKLVEKEKQQLKTIFVVGDCSDDDQPDLICCFDKDLNDDIVTAIAKMQPLYAVFRDASMSTDSVAVNFDQIFETYSPTTTRKII